MSIGRILAQYDAIFNTCSQLRNSTGEIQTYTGNGGQIANLTSGVAHAWVGDDQKVFEERIRQYAQELDVFVTNLEGVIASVESAATALQEQELAAAAAAQNL